MKRYFFLICYFFFSNFSILNAVENKIEFKINNEIITTIDIIKELNFLAVFNPKILELDKDKIFEISKNSTIKEKIKIIEILKFKKKIEIDNNYLSQLVEESYMKIDLNSEDEFLEHLSRYKLEFDDLKKKLTVEALWNQLIFFKFKDKIKIDEKKIKKEIVNDKNNKIKLFNLSEIIFNVGKNQNLNEKFEQIKKEISLNGFENTATIYSVSQTGNIGGKLGWISQNSINMKLNNKIKELNVGEYTQPIVIPGGFLVIKLNEIKKEEKKINLDKEIKKQIAIKTHQQLNQFSNMYYNKIKKDIKIEKL